MLRMQEMDLGISADCSLKTSAQFSAVIKTGNKTHWVWKTQPTQSCGPMTGPRTKGVFQKAAKQVPAFLYLKAATMAQEKGETTSNNQDPAFTFPTASSWQVLYDFSLTLVSHTIYLPFLPTSQFHPFPTSKQAPTSRTRGFYELESISPTNLFSLHSAHMINQRTFITNRCFKWTRTVLPAGTKVV